MVSSDQKNILQATSSGERDVYGVVGDDGVANRIEFNVGEVIVRFVHDGRQCERLGPIPRGGRSRHHDPSPTSQHSSHLTDVPGCRDVETPLTAELVAIAPAQHTHNSQASKTQNHITELCR